MPDTHTTARGSIRLTRLGDRLDAEWHALRTSRRACQQASAWRSPAGDHPLDAALDAVFARQPHDLGRLVDATQRHAAGADGDGEAVLGRLVELARGDELACRIVVQRLLPALVHAARPYGRTGERVDPMAVAVPALCLAIHAFDADRRSRHVAASLVSDAIFQAFRRPLRRKSSTEIAQAPHVFEEYVATTEPSPLEVLAAAEHDARCGGAEQCDLDLLHELAVHPQWVIAARLAVTTRTVRNRRDRAVANVRQALGIAA